MPFPPYFKETCTDASLPLDIALPYDVVPEGHRPSLSIDDSADPDL